MIATVKTLIVAAALAHFFPTASGPVPVSAPLMDAIISCETGRTYDPFIVGNNRTTFGLGQLHVRGKLPTFYAAGYDNWADPAQQVNFMAEQIASGQQWAWVQCLPR